jgi:hypothetical protein
MVASHGLYFGFFAFTARPYSDAHLRAAFTRASPSNRDSGGDALVGAAVVVVVVVDGAAVVEVELVDDELLVLDDVAGGSSPPPQAASDATAPTSTRAPALRSIRFPSVLGTRTSRGLSTTNPGTG